MILAACLAALLTSQGVDLATTVVKIRTPYYREGNPLLPRSTSGVVAVKVGVTTSLVVWGWKIRKSHPRKTVVIWISGATFGTLGAWHNTHQS